MKWVDRESSVWRSKGESDGIKKQRQLEVKRLLEELRKQKTRQIISEMFPS